MNRKTIALIDDHAMLRTGLASLITDLTAFEILIEADNGQDFIEKLAKQTTTPDLILLDISMPIMDGFATATWISENLPQSKVLVLSMMDDEQSIIKMLRLGARGYILKDGEPEVLEQALFDVVKNGYHFNDVVNNRLMHTANQGNAGQATESLNQKEIEFLKFCCSEDTYKEIASKMNLSPRTIDGYRDNLFEKLGIKNRVGLVLYSLKHKIMTI